MPNQQELLAMLLGQQGQGMDMSGAQTPDMSTELGTNFDFANDNMAPMSAGELGMEDPSNYAGADMPDLGGMIGVNDMDMSGAQMPDMGADLGVNGGMVGMNGMGSSGGNPAEMNFRGDPRAARMDYTAQVLTPEMKREMMKQYMRERMNFMGENLP